MSVLDEVNASAGTDVIIYTLELTCAAWPSSMLVCNGFDDQTLITEDGRTLTFTAISLGTALASKDNKGNQVLTFVVSDDTGEVSELTDLATAANERVTCVFRKYLASNLTAPAEKPYRLSLLSGTIQGLVAQLQCGYFNVIGVAWPRQLYTVTYVPSLRYV